MIMGVVGSHLTFSLIRYVRMVWTSNRQDSYRIEKLRNCATS
jgi:hypothetical protein